MDFRDRAWFEAERYGADPWIFVRELLQNGRDAGASAVSFTITERDGFVRLTCSDDGDGMTEEHAKQFLFRLYASSKENEEGAAGRFGVGFWSILRFDPSDIVIRSWPQDGRPWEIALDGNLKHAASGVPPAGQRGTELTLTRPLTPNVAEQVKRAAWTHGRYLTTRADRRVPLQITVDGDRITEELQLPAPSATFHRRGVRGVVALGTTPQVELFSKGLHVRTAASVDELLAAPDAGKSRQLDPLLEGLAPQVILDGDELDLVRSRSDARDDKALKRAVELSQRELARLIDRQLAFSRPVSVWKRLLRPALGVTAAAAFVVGSAWAVTSFLDHAPQREQFVVAPPQPAPEETPPPRTVPYRDPSDTYHGPQVDPLPRSAGPIDLDYFPSSRTLHLASLHLDSPADRAMLVRDDVSAAYPAVHCTRDCLRLALTVDAQPGWVRLPVPTGYVVDTGTLSWDGVMQRVMRTRQGEPVVWVESYGAVYISYRVGPGVPVVDAARSPVEPLPAGVPDVSGLPLDRKAAVLRDWVAEHVAYSNDPALQKRLGALDALGYGFVPAVLRIGEGDCDVQNAVLASLLRSSGVSARLTIGYVGRNGHADALLHAWAEYRAPGGPWKAIDASAPGGVPPAVAGTAWPAEVPGAAVGLVDPEPLRTPAPALDIPSPPIDVPARFRLAVPTWQLPSRALGLLGAAPLLALAFVLLRPRVKRQVQLDEEHDVSRLLRGALARPEAFHHVPALFERPLIPRRGGGAISLGLAYELAAAERLYSSDAGLAFSERAVKAGAVVIDAMRPEGKVVAEALGAVNLDRWDQLLRGAHTPPLFERVNGLLHERGEGLRVMLSDEITREPAVLRVPGTKAERWVVVNADAQWLARAAAQRPSRAVFEVVDAIAQWLRLGSTRRARLLAPLASAAMAEELRGELPPPISEVGEGEAQAAPDKVRV